VISYVVAGVFCVTLWTIVVVFGLPWLIAVVPTGAVLGSLLGIWLWQRFQSGKAAREIERSLDNQADQFAKRARPDQKAEIDALRAEFDRAVGAIKSSKLSKSGAAALYALPWYVIIGPPGAGKSTALRNSGLKFPYLSKRGGVRGVGGTRNCDWWMTNEAVLLDTAGRYTTDEDDREEWLAFLDMMRRTRPKRPLNGLILAVSVEALMAGNEAELENTAHNMRSRVDEVLTRLGVVMPVYLLFTKCDLLPGFVESFEDLRLTERGQVWGVTLPVRRSHEPLSELVTKGFDRLVQVVERRAIARLESARTVDARERIYGFPQDFEALSGNLGTFVAELFTDNAYQDGPVVRGVYFTSGTQEGNPISRVMSGMAAAYGLPPERMPQEARGEGKSYFLGDLFKQVIFPDEGVATESAETLVRRRLVALGVAGLMVLAASAIAAVPAYAYVQNSRLVKQVRGAVRAVAAYDTAGVASLPLHVIDPLRDTVTTLVENEKEGAPLQLTMGFYQGSVLRPAVADYYTRTLRRVLFQPVVHQSEREMVEFVQANQSLEVRPTVSQHARMYNLLKTYLLLTSPKAATEPSIDEDTSKWLTSALVGNWERINKGISPEERASIETHARAYLQLLAADPKLGFTRDAHLVRQVRDLLSRMPTVKLAVDRIVSEVDDLGWDVSVEQVVGASGLPLTGTGRVQGAFTRRAWEEYVRPLLSTLPRELLGETWVLESTAAGSEGVSEHAKLCLLRSEYFSRYIDQWRQLISTLRTEEPRDRTQALTILQDLTRGQPAPFERAARTIAFNARLEEEKPKAKDDPVEAAKEGVIDSLKKRIQDNPIAAAVLRKNDPCAKGDYITNAHVRTALRGFYGFGVADDVPEGQSGGGQLTAVQVYQEQLMFVRDALQAYADDPGTSEPLLARLSAARNRIKGLIEAQEVGWRPRFDALLWPPVNGASIASNAAVAGEKGSQWCTSVELPFARTLRGRYPFNRAGQDSSIADVTEFYKPGSGIVWSFYESRLSRDIARVGDRYRSNVGSGVASMYNVNLVEFLNRSQAISTALFPGRADKPTVAMEIRVRPSPGIASVLLTIDGQLIDFHNGPEKWVPIRWPGDGGQRGAHMRVRGAAIDEIIQQDGEWGFFRLMDKGNVSASQGERFFTVRWRLRTQNDVIVDVRPARAENPFIGETGRALEAFRSNGVDAPRAVSPGGPACEQ
jgi:type VI secretion system protein ImpL